jgi:hypothetical protein
MRALLFLAAVAGILTSQGVLAACTPLRFGFVDQHRPPYYLGNGAQEATPPGASVDLVREFVTAAGCNIIMSRLPVPRVRQSLGLGLIDAAPIDAIGDDTANFAFPLDKTGRPDRDKALQLVTILFVRSADKIARNTDPMVFLKNRRLGLVHGAPYGEPLRKAGIEVDDGALDANRNFDKLLRGRIDAFAVSLTSAHDMDDYIEKEFGKGITRLDTPIRATYIWFAVNKTYYARNREYVDGMWKWFGVHGRRRFAELLKSYDKDQ